MLTAYSPLGSEGSPLLSNHTVKKIAIIGPNAKALVSSGGGSAALRTAYLITPFEGITSALSKDVEVTYHEGCAGMWQQRFLLSRLLT